MASSFVSFAKRHPVIAYYIVVFVLGWGGGLLAGGLGGLLGTTVSARTQMLVNMPIGILGTAIAGVLMTWLVHGKEGLRWLQSRLLRWRVGGGWYAFALLTAPVITTASLLARSTPPVIATTSDKVGLLLMGLAIGVGSSPFFEELGWTGFATPEIRKRFGVLATGLLMGVLWGIWHFPAFSATGRASEPLTPVVFTVALLFTVLIPYRILMVWLYDHTQSLLLVMIMHVPLVVEKFVLYPPEASSTFTAVSNLIEAAALWVVVAVIFVVSRGRLEAPMQPRPQPA